MVISRPTPYIGITDFNSAEDSWNMVLSMRENFDLLGVGVATHYKKRKLMIGVMMSLKTLSDIPSKWSNIFPQKERIQRIFVSDPLALNTLHYADYDNLTTLLNLLDATQYCGPNINAIQFDMIWPDSEMILKYKKSNPDLRIILQISSHALDEVSNDPKKLSEKLKTYENSLDDVLLDKSGGKGIGLCADDLRPFVDILAHDHEALGLTVAGGLGPDTLGSASSLVEDYSFLSLDAQSRLRSSGSSMDPVEWDRASRYLMEAMLMFRRVNSLASR